MRKTNRPSEHVGVYHHPLIPSCHHASISPHDLMVLGLSVVSFWDLWRLITVWSGEAKYEKEMHYSFQNIFFKVLAVTDSKEASAGVWMWLFTTTESIQQCKKGQFFIDQIGFYLSGGLPWWISKVYCFHLILPQNFWPSSEKPQTDKLFFFDIVAL